jgi:hypothetical protein
MTETDRPGSCEVVARPGASPGGRHSTTLRERSCRRPGMSKDWHNQWVEEGAVGDWTTYGGVVGEALEGSACLDALRADHQRESGDH